jgi:hypothetical protein
MCGNTPNSHARRYCQIERALRGVESTASGAAGGIPIARISLAAEALPTLSFRLDLAMLRR